MAGCVDCECFRDMSFSGDPLASGATVYVVRLYRGFLRNRCEVSQKVCTLSVRTVPSPGAASLEISWGPQLMQIN